MKRKFAFNLFLFGTGWLVIFYSLSFISNKFDPQRNKRINNVLNKADSIEALALGNSHSCAIDFSELGYNGYRIAEGGNDLFEVDYQVKVLLPYLPKLEVVFINISYFSFFADNSTITEHIAFLSKTRYDDFIEKYPFTTSLIKPLDFGTYLVFDLEKIDSQKKNKLGEAWKELEERTGDRSLIRLSYYKTLPEWRWIEGDFLSFVKSRFTPIVREDHWAGIVTKLFKSDEKKTGKSAMDIYGQFDDERANSYMDFNKLEKQTEDISVPWYTYLQEWPVMKNPNVVNDSYNALRNAVSVLRISNIRVVFYTSPVFKKFTELYDKRKIKIMEDYMDKLKEEFDIEYYNFADDTTFILSNKLFHNSDHLNREGAKLFSRKLKELFNRGT